MKKITCISDTHSLHNKMKHSLGSSDILIHAGDLTNVGTRYEVEEIIAFFHRQLENFNDIIFIAGNHDRSFDPTFTERGKGFIRSYKDNKDIETYGLEKPKWLLDLLGSMDKRIHYLENSSIDIDGLKFYGSPMTPDFWKEYWAFNEARGSAISNYWDMIPKDTNVLITHGPANNILDKLENEIDHVGCEDLEYKVKYELSNLKLHVVGHIHHSYGTYSNNYGTTYVNASICTESYEPINAPISVDIY